MKRIILIFSLLFICAGPVMGASELSKINAQIKQTEQQNKQLEQQLKTSDREVSKTKKGLVRAADKVSSLEDKRAEMAKKIAADFKGADLAGYNSARFDLPMLAEEFLRADVDIDLSTRKMVDVQTIFHKKEQRTLSAAYKFYCKADLTDAHAAMADTQATYDILKAQLDVYPDLQNDMAFLADYTCTSKNVDFAGRIVYNDKGVEVINFGKYKGQPVADVLQNDPGYYGWIMGADFPLTTKQAFTRLLLKTKM